MSTVPLGELDELRAERIGRIAARWDREDDDDREPFEQLVARDARYEMTPDGVLHRVISCAGCGLDVRLPWRAPIPPGAAVHCEQCRGHR